MSTTLVTTIGTGNYTPTTYTFSTQESFRTSYVAEAICRLKGIPKAVFLLTQAARQKHWDPLQRCFGALGIEIEDRGIPDGQTEAETWQIFDTLVEAIPPNSQVIFDVTHAFRSIPILVVLGAAFLRTAKNVQIQGLYYGLYRPGQEHTPIVDLTPALRLLDWLTATDKFITTGSAQELGALLNTVQQDFHRHHKPGVPKPLKLQGFGSTIQDISRSIELMRPISLLEKHLPRLLKQSTAELSQEVSTFAKPFSLLLSTIQSTYADLALPADDNSPRQQLYRQFQLLRWYIEKGHTLQAILFAREWIISALCISQGICDYCDKEPRESAENLLGRYHTTPDHPDYLAAVAPHVSDPTALAQLWSQLSEYRNDLAHTQMRPKPISAQTLGKFAPKLVPTLTELFPHFTTLEVSPSNSPDTQQETKEA